MFHLKFEEAREDYNEWTYSFTYLDSFGIKLQLEDPIPEEKDIFLLDLAILIGSKSKAAALLAYKELSSSAMNLPFTAKLVNVDCDSLCIESPKILRGINQITSTYEEQHNGSYQENAYLLSEKHQKVFVDWVFEAVVSQFKDKNDNDNN